MSSPANTSQAGREASANGSATSNVDDKPRLSEHEKKANHIASGECCLFLLAEAVAGAIPFAPSSRAPVAFNFRDATTDTRLLEQKRRQAIREGFDRLTELVPGLEGQGRSESIVLNKTVLYMRQQLREREQLVERIEQLGGNVNDGFKK
ncbi:hypothetical protein V491_03322 [Pseudogymnoascus sp. VKM F-3775]|nr:hypothetical protein V491_03322 [Pseudogymnoascus sp. VKM F-3775]